MISSNSTSSTSSSALPLSALPSPRKLIKPPSCRVNWHEAAVCALEIELRDFADILEFHSEYVLGKNNYHIDFLIIKLLSSQPIPKNIARCFNTYNLFEIKGIHSSITTSAYYKTIGYAALLLDKLNDPARYISQDVSITFLCFHYPRKMIRCLQRNVDFSIEKFSEGIYYIHNETFGIQIIVTRELPPEENLYLHCLTNNLQNDSLINQISKDYEMHRDQTIYNKYLRQLSIANFNTKGGVLMAANEWIFNLFGTSSEEILENARQNFKQELEEYYLPKIDELSASNKQLSSSNAQLFSSNKQLSSSNEQLSTQNDYLKGLLRKHNISFE